MKGIILLSISILLAVCCQGEFYISTVESHWSDASSHCTMATPSVTYRPTGHLDISGIDIPDKESLWIGYYTVVRVFEYLDCVKLDDFTMDKQLKTLNIKGSPSQCFPGCGNTSIIGVTLSKCFCIEENYNEVNRFMEKTCTTPCLHPRGTACGLENKNGSYLSVYRVNENATRFSLTVPIHKDEKNCLVFNRSYQYFAWKDCSQSFEVGCDTGVGLHGDTGFGVLTKTSKGYLLNFKRDSEKRRILCQGQKPSKTDIEQISYSVTVNIMIAVVSVIAVAIIVVVLTVFLVKKRRTNQGTRLTDVGYVPEQANYITPISDEAVGGKYSSIQDNGTGETSEEIGIQNLQKIVYESLGERNDEEPGYETANTKMGAYESLGERKDEEHSYGTPNTHRSAYESLGDRCYVEHGYGTPNTHKSAYESLGERYDEEHSYGASAQAISGFYQPLEEERLATHNYKIAGKSRVLTYDSLGDKIKGTHCDETSGQTANVKPYEWV
ncbi:uncharacterized protein LOC123559441 isoform X2 [Mercenaria mercenaria]|uniref:uncharacterized protein LOC123559441 isoform X2 n=1 Tax=Mercenaria mercenaria TaxID=6596 RepID=UPI00234E8BBD|nr:uncharacterized protein LOC123559441 isoform X2 [Mercenaria mercenaria]